MSWAWTDPIVDGETDWLDVAFLNQFWSACRERMGIYSNFPSLYNRSSRRNGFTRDPIAGFPVTAEGEDVTLSRGQYSNFGLWYDWQSDLETAAGGAATLWDLQNVVYLLTGSTDARPLDPGYDPNGYPTKVLWMEPGRFDALESYTGSAPEWTQGQLWEAAGLPAPQLVNAQWTAPFTRKYPKEFGSLTSAALGNPYMNPGTAQDGDRARYTVDGRTYRYDQFGPGGASQWVLCDPQTYPDVVVAQGPIAAGDIIGAWIFEELRALLNVMLIPRLPWDTRNPADADPVVRYIGYLSGTTTTIASMGYSLDVPGWCQIAATRDYYANLGQHGNYWTISAGSSVKVSSILDGATAKLFLHPIDTPELPTTFFDMGTWNYPLGSWTGVATVTIADGKATCSLSFPDNPIPWHDPPPGSPSPYHSMGILLGEYWYLDGRTIFEYQP